MRVGEWLEGWHVRRSMVVPLGVRSCLQLLLMLQVLLLLLVVQVLQLLLLVVVVV